MISQSRDGEIIAKMASRNGRNPVWGSSSKGGMEALKKIIKLDRVKDREIFEKSKAEILTI